MRVESVEFLAFARSVADYPPRRLPEVAFAGRSNVGKSSLINAVTGRANLARTSGTPGKTRAILFYRVNSSFDLVDLPGYGYARVSKQEQEYWGRMVRAYLDDQTVPRLVVLLVDIRLDPQALDRQMKSWLEAAGTPHLVVATKADKLPAGRRAAAVRRLTDAYGGVPVIPFSTLSPLGRQPLWARVREFLESDIKRSQEDR